MLAKRDSLPFPEIAPMPVIARDAGEVPGKTNGAGGGILEAKTIAGTAFPRAHLSTATLDGVATLANLPPTSRQRRSIHAIIIFLVFVYGETIHFVSVETPQLTVFLIVILTLIMASNFLSAGLMLVQSLLASSAGLMILASGYLYSSLIMIPYLLTFPQIFGAKPVLGNSLQDAPFLYLCWHFGFLAAVCCYVAFRAVPLKRAGLLAVLGAATTIGIICLLVWAIVRHDDMLPLLMQENLGVTSLGRYGAAFDLSIGILAMALLWIRSRSLLDYWLVVVVCLIVFELSLATFFLVTRNSVGAILVRSYFAISSVVILTVLLAESTRVYADVARANLLLRRERNSRLMNMQAMAASIAHEVRQPLGAIVTSGGAAIRFLERSPPNTAEALVALNRIISDGHRTSAVFEDLRTLFGKAEQVRQAININDVVCEALENLRPEFQANGITILSELADNLPSTEANRGQLQEALLNLLHNASEAFIAAASKDRIIWITTSSTGPHTVNLEIEDSGPGIEPASLKNVFEAFVTTKPQGTGLGLAICRMIVEDHGGKITAANGRHGAVFKITLPI